jgi:hypothetical protein
MIECPHCFTRVIPTSEGECPACRRNVRETGGTDPTKTTLSIADGAATLPRYCCDCGRSTERRLKVKCKITSDVESGWAAVLSTIFAALTGVFVGGIEDDPHRRVTLVIRIPQCEMCASHGRPVPVRVNLEESRMTFVVHKEFESRVVEQETR